LAIDPVVVSAEVLLALQKVISRNIDPFEPGVLTFGKIQGGTTTNIIPDAVALVGTLRSMNEKWRKKCWRLIERSVRGITRAAGATYEIQIDKGYPVLVNNPEVTAFAEVTSAAYLGRKNVFDSKPSMGSEDFSYYLQQVPGTFFKLGVRNRDKGIVHSAHTARFDVDEEAMKVGSGLLAYLVYEFLNQES
jgi:amidohydrolase